MKYLICDDNIEFMRDLSSRIKSCEPNSEIETFQTSADLLFHIQGLAGSVDAIFMDIQLNGSNGIDIAMEIYEKYPSIKIVYVTGYGERYAEKIFMCPSGLSPVSYLIKPVKDNMLKNALNRVHDNDNNNGKFLVPFKIGKNVSYIDSDNIHYLSVMGRKITVSTNTGIVEFNGSFSECLNLLPEWFVRCHRSYCVNIRHICAINRWQDIIMMNGDCIPVGRNYADELRKAVTLKSFELRKLKE